MMPLSLALLRLVPDEVAAARTSVVLEIGVTAPWCAPL
jgi:hypothetical protein